MIQDLELAKKETWEEKERLSAKYVDERTKNLASKVSACARKHKLIHKTLEYVRLYLCSHQVIGYHQGMFKLIVL